MYMKELIILWFEGCEDIRPLFEKLNEFTFDLPVDLAIRPFHNKEAY